jgi:hypothetical protein
MLLLRPRRGDDRDLAGDQGGESSEHTVERVARGVIVAQSGCAEPAITASFRDPRARLLSSAVELGVYT